MCTPFTDQKVVANEVVNSQSQQNYIRTATRHPSPIQSFVLTAKCACSLVCLFSFIYQNKLIKWWNQPARARHKTMARRTNLPPQFCQIFIKIQRIRFAIAWVSERTGMRGETDKQTVWSYSFLTKPSVHEAGFKETQTIRPNVSRVRFIVRGYLLVN